MWYSATYYAGIVLVVPLYAADFAAALEQALELALAWEMLLLSLTACTGSVKVL